MVNENAAAVQTAINLIGADRDTHQANIDTFNADIAAQTDALAKAQATRDATVAAADAALATEQKTASDQIAVDQTAIQQEQAAIDLNNTTLDGLNALLTSETPTPAVTPAGLIA